MSSAQHAARSGSTQNASTAGAPMSETAFDTAARRTQLLNEKAAFAVDRLQRVLARAFGSPPPNDDPTSIRAVPGGAVAVLSDKLDTLEQTAQQLHDLIDRLDTLV